MADARNRRKGKPPADAANEVPGTKNRGTARRTGIRKTYKGLVEAKAVHDPQVSVVLEGLTKRQIQAMYLLLEGYNEADIADLLELSKHTVHNHIRGLYKQLGIANRFELAMYCFHAGLIGRDASDAREPVTRFSQGSTMSAHLKHINHIDGIMVTDRLGHVRFAEGYLNHIPLITKLGKALDACFERYTMSREGVGVLQEVMAGEIPDADPADFQVRRSRTVCRVRVLPTLSFNRAIGYVVLVYQPQVTAKRNARQNA